MEAARDVFFPSPYLRSCKQETDEPVEGETKGEIPSWLSGCLIRVGSGLLEIGPDRFNHVFDGMALMHRFGFRDGRVTYQNRFLRSDTYKRNMKANRIVVSEFATPAVPDPCRTIFQRFFSLFSLDEMTDNDLVNIVMYTDEAYACSETNCIWKINPDSLESERKVKLSSYVPVNGAIAHPHEDTDGTVYNVGSTYGYNCSFLLLKFPPKETKKTSEEDSFERGSVVCRIPSSKSLQISYHHSFAMTERHFVVVEQPLYLSIPRLAYAHFIAGAYADSMHWDDQAKTRFHVVNRQTGELLDTVYLSDGFFVFHHINAYEEDNNLVVDMCCYDEGGIVKALYVKALEEMVANQKQSSNPFSSRAKRFVLPLTTGTKRDAKENLVTLSYTKASAFQQPDGSIFCKPEVLTGSEPWCPELPRINYEKYNGRKYKYFYAMARKCTGERTHIIKVDTTNLTTVTWSEEGVIPSEPVFISQPDAGNEEDSGIVLASLLYRDDDKKVSMLVLNAKTMEEMGRTTFSTPSSVPGDFHGTFIPK